MVKSSLREQGLPHSTRTEAEIIFNDDLAEALEGLTGFARVTVVFWMHEVSVEGRNLRQLRLGGLAGSPLVGVFATRTQNRPNPIGVTTVELLSVQGTRLQVRGLDALDGTPVLDIRPYLPPYDAFPEAAVPPWVWGASPGKAEP